MEHFQIAFQVVAPLVIYMAVGGLVRALGILKRETLLEMNSFIFKVMIPISLFFDIYGADLGSAVDGKLFFWTAALVTATFAVALLVCRKTIPQGPDIPTVAQGIARSNYVLFGTVISYSLAGEAGTAVTAALAVLVVPLFNILAVVVFEIQRGGRISWKKLLWQIVKNPLVEAGILGAAVNLSGLKLPGLLYEPLNTLGDIASPLALVVLGGMLSFKSMVSHKGRLLAAVFCRLVAVPVVCLGIMAALGFRDETLVALLAVFASPTAVASAPMAQSLGGSGVLAGEIVALTTAGSILTVFLFIAAFKAMGMF